MNGSKMTSMTLEEMRAARERGESKTDWARIRESVLRDEEPAEDEDSPDASELMHEYLEKCKQEKRKHKRLPVSVSLSDTPKIPMRFECDLDTIARLCASGSGDLRTRLSAAMSAALADWLKTHSPQELSFQCKKG